MIKQKTKHGGNFWSLINNKETLTKHGFTNI